MSDISKFNWVEIFNNKDGKTSGSGFLGILFGITGILSFIACIIAWYLKMPNLLDVMGNVIWLIACSSALMGVRKFMGGKDKPSIDNDDKTI